MNGKAMNKRLPENVISEIYQSIEQARLINAVCGCIGEGVIDDERAGEIATNLCYFIADEMDKMKQGGK